MSKYELLPAQLIHEGTLAADNLFSPRDVKSTEILAVHRRSYWEKLSNLKLTKQEERRTGFPLSSELIEREVNIVGGTINCVDYAYKYGISMNVAGGTHHAHTDKGEGFCLLNDQAIATQYILDSQRSRRVLIVDLDVHQGNGTAEIFQGNPQVFTFSMHGEKNYPMKKEQSDLDIGLPDGCDDRFYLSTLRVNLSNVLDQFQPDFIFYQSGVDILETDRLGRLSVSAEGCMERDKLVLESAKKNGIPLVASMGGGYSLELNDIVQAHANTFRLAQEIYF